MSLPSDEEPPQIWADRTTMLGAVEALAQVGSFQWNVLEGRIHWSDQLYRILGYENDVEPSQEGWFSRIHPNDLRELTESGAFRLEEGGPPRLEFRIVRPSGELRWVTMQTESVASQDDRVTHMRGIVMDVTDRRRLELELQHSQKMQAIGRLAGSVAHDFNNMLTIVQANVELLRRKPDVRSLDAIERSVELASQLTQQLLSFSRHAPLAPTLCSLNECLERSSSFVRRILGDGVELQLDLAGDLPPVLLDEGQFQQAILNLAANARDAMPEGGHIKISTSRIVEPGRERVRVSVSDSGVGMTEEVQARALDPFFTTKERGKGTGLGLSSVYGFVSAQGGRMEMISEPQKGTQVHLFFLPSSGVPAESIEFTLSVPPQGCRVVVVEDNAEVLAPLTVSLREAGQSVEAFTSPREALRSLLAGGVDCDVLLTDLNMPEISGPSLIRELRAVRPELPVVMMTGFSAEAGPELDARTVLIRKPFGAARVLDALAQVMRL